MTTETTKFDDIAIVDHKTTNAMAQKIWDDISAKLRNDTVWKETGVPHNFDYAKIIAYHLQRG